MARIVKLNKDQAESLGTFSTIVEHEGTHLGLGITNRGTDTMEIQLLGNDYHPEMDLDDFLDDHTEISITSQEAQLDEAASWNAAADLLDKLASVARHNAVQAKAKKPYGTQRGR